MMWKIIYTTDAKGDLDKIDNSIKNQLQVGIRKVSRNPLPKSEGGYVNPLGSINGINLTGYFKIKYKKIGVRVVYTLNRFDNEMIIVVISARADDKCYKDAKKRKDKV